jgi:hypothetical protein
MDEVIGEIVEAIFELIRSWKVLVVVLVVVIVIALVAWRLKQNADACKAEQSKPRPSSTCVKDVDSGLQRPIHSRELLAVPKVSG